MSKVYDAIIEKKWFKNEFKTWEASEIIIDKNRALYQLKKPNSEYQKVCMFRDGTNVFFYGDYGQFSFENMPCITTPQNLQYDNISHQMDKLNRDNKESIMVFDVENAIKDIIEWGKDRLINRFDISDYGIKTIIRYLNGNIKGCFDAYDLVEKHPSLVCADDFIDLLDCMIQAVNDGEWCYHNYLNEHYNELEKYDEVCECNLWTAGKTIHQRFFINLYAMEVCGKKLKQQKGCE